jgi:hypothetical protein
MGRYLNESWRNRVGRCGLGSFDSGQGSVVGSCENDNEPSGSIKGGLTR